jgi:hypothetical protein
MAAHAACSPSSAGMWMACAASVTKTKDAVRPSSKYAKEGTAAHAVADMILNGDVVLPDKVVVEGDEYVVSRGMCLALNPYVTYVQSLMALPRAKVFLEHRTMVPGTSGKVWGTLDCGVYSTGRWHKNPHLYVADLKFGKGVTVGPEGPQLRFYALGLANLVAETRRKTKVTLTICQPRVGGDPLKHHETTLGELQDWQADVVGPALSNIIAGDETETAGAHCRWCVRKTECAAFANKHQGHAASAFDDGGLFA